MSKGELHVGREQTLVEHFTLQKYPERFATIDCPHRDKSQLRGGCRSPAPPW